MPKKRTMIYSNVKQNKKRAEEISRIKDDQINLDDEIFIGLSNDTPIEKKIRKSEDKTNTKKKKKNKKSKINKRPRSNKHVENEEIIDEFLFDESKSNPKKKQKKKISKIKVSILLIVIIAGLVAFLSSPIFNIREIEIIINNEMHLNKDDIGILSDINVGENVFSTSKRHIRNEIEKNPYVQSVKITRKLPNKIKIEVVERSVKFQIKQDEKFINIDNQGYIIDETEERAEGIVLISGYTSKQFVSGDRLEEGDLSKLSDVMQILQEAQNNEIIDKITQIDITDSDNYKVYFDNDGKIAYIGDINSINDKMAYIKKILEMESDYEGEIFVNVDLSGGEYPYFRERV